MTELPGVVGDEEVSVTVAVQVDELPTLTGEVQFTDVEVEWSTTLYDPPVSDATISIPLLSRTWF